MLDLEGIDIHSVEQIIALQKSDPENSIYVSMGYGRIDEHGKIHGRHSLRLKEIRKSLSKPGGYEFVLVNPWDNSKEEVLDLSVEELKSRKPRFGYFPKDHITEQLIKNLNLEMSYIGEALANPPLLEMLKNLIESGSPTREDKIKLIKACRFNTHLTLIYGALSKHKREQFISNILQAKNSEEIEKLISPKLNELIHICLQNQDKTLFNELKAANFIDYAANSPLGEETFIKRLLELAMTQSPLDIKLLTEIAAYVENSEPKLPVQFEFKDLFGLVYNKTLADLSEKLGDNTIEAVNAELINLFLSKHRKADSITLSEELRELFVREKSLFIEQVQSIDSEQWLIQAIPLLLEGKLSTEGAKLIKEKPFILSEETIGKLMENFDAENPRVCLEQIFKLSQVNDSVGKALLHFTIKYFDEQFSQTNLNQFRLSLEDEKPSKFKDWFNENLPQSKDTEIDKAIKTIVDKLALLNEMSVDFGQCQSIEEIKEKSNEFVNQLNIMAQDSSLLEALARLEGKDYDSASSRINSALAVKFEMAREQAHHQVLNIEKAYNTISNLIEKIEKSEISFKEANSKQEIESCIKEYQQQLLNLTTTDEARSAFQLLGYPKQLNVLLANKKNDAYLAGKSYLADLIAAQSIVDSAIQQLNLIDTKHPFDHLDKEDKVDDKLNAMHENLNAFLNNPKLIDAQKVLGLNQHNSPLQQLINDKKISLVNGANLQLEAIKAQKAQLEQAMPKLEKTNLNELIKNCSSFVKANDYQEILTLSSRIQRRMEDLEELNKKIANASPHSSKVFMAQIAKLTQSIEEDLHSLSAKINTISHQVGQQSAANKGGSPLVQVYSALGVNKRSSVNESQGKFDALTKEIEKIQNSMGLLSNTLDNKGEAQNIQGQLFKIKYTMMTNTCEYLLKKLISHTQAEGADEATLNVGNYSAQLNNNQLVIIQAYNDRNIDGGQQIRSKHEKKQAAEHIVHEMARGDLFTLVEGHLKHLHETLSHLDPESKNNPVDIREILAKYKLNQGTRLNEGESLQFGLLQPVNKMGFENKNYQVCFDSKGDIKVFDKKDQGKELAGELRQEALIQISDCFPHLQKALKVERIEQLLIQPTIRAAR
ncbi:hypothetical protein [Legionella sp. W05-934-2]|uniref:hypothetical protein n=1 Tax=Legionella sp. W05-934-2 TaxID=1198649 RepID=UPI0034630BDD